AQLRIVGFGARARFESAVAAEETPMASEMIGLIMAARADEAEPSGSSCVLGQVFADLDARDTGLNGHVRAANVVRSIRFQVVGFEVTGAAVCEQQNDGRVARFRNSLGLQPRNFTKGQPS